MWPVSTSEQTEYIRRLEERIAALEVRLASHTPPQPERYGRPTALTRKA